MGEDRTFAVGEGDVWVVRAWEANAVDQRAENGWYWCAKCAKVTEILASNATLPHTCFDCGVIMERVEGADFASTGHTRVGKRSAVGDGLSRYRVDAIGHVYAGSMEEAREMIDAALQGLVPWFFHAINYHQEPGGEGGA